MKASAFFVVLGGFLAGGALAAEFERISKTPFVATGTQPGETVVEEQAFSADGRYFLFASSATALLPGVLDLNGSLDLFVKDMSLGTLRLVTHPAGLPNLTGSGRATGQRLSGDGTVVVFGSSAHDLIPVTASSATSYLAYWHDLESGETRLICHRHGQPAAALSCSTFDLPLSADGRYVLVEVYDDVSLFIPGATDANGGDDDLLIWDSATDTYELVSHVPGNPLLATPDQVFASYPRLSADGRFAAFLTRNPWLVAGDGGSSADIFIYDRQTRVHQLVSHADAAPGTPANADSLAICGLTGSGRYLLFESWASDLVSGVTDPSLTADLFLWDRSSGAAELISRQPSPATATGNGASRCGWLSEDARYVYFNSWASNLVPSVIDGNSPDLFLRDRQQSLTRLVTRRWSSPQTAAGGSMEKIGAVSADGKTMVFSDSTSQLVDATHYGDPPWSFRYDPDLDRVEVALEASIPPGSTVESRVAALSPDGASSVFLTPWAAFLTGAPGPERDYPLPVAHGTADNAVRLVAPAAYSGEALPSYGVGLEPPAVSGDGSRVVFPNGGSEICDTTSYALCLYDRAAGTYENVNHHPANPSLGLPQKMTLLDLSEPDGRYLLVQSRSPVLAQVDTNGVEDLFLYDTETGSFELITRRQGTTGTAANGITDMFAWRSVMTPDAAQVVFESRATDLVAGLVDTSGTGDLFLRDRASGLTSLISHRAGQPLTTANSSSQYPTIAAMGHYVVFESRATDLVAGFADGNGSSGDIYLFSAASGAVTLVSHAAGSPSQGGNSFIGGYFLSANGRFVAYSSSSSNLAAGVTDGNASSDAFLFDRATGESTLLSHAAGQPRVAASGGSSVTGMTSDGRYLLISSSAADLMPGLVDFEKGLFLLDRDTGSLRLVSQRPGQPGASVGTGWSLLGPGAQRVYFTSDAVDFLPGTVDRNRKNDLFAWERESGRIELVTARYGSSTTTANDDCDSNGPNTLLDDNGGLVLQCNASDLLPHAGPGVDLLLVTFPQALFADGFESGDTAAWSP